MKTSTSTIQKLAKQVSSDFKVFCFRFDSNRMCRIKRYIRPFNQQHIPKIRRRLAIGLPASPPLKGGTADESYFGPHRVNVVNADEVLQVKPSCLVLLKRDGNIYTEIAPNASKASLQAIIRGKADINSIIHTDGWRGYDGLVDIGFDKHFRVNHGADEFVNGSNHVNGIESF